MEDLLIETLSEFSFPICLQGSLLADEPYPDNFFTFWERTSYGESHYDNVECSTVYEYDVNFYSIDPEKVYNILREAINKLKAVGFIVSGSGYSVPSGVATHDGRGITVKYLKIN